MLKWIMDANDLKRIRALHPDWSIDDTLAVCKAEVQESLNRLEKEIEEYKIVTQECIKLLKS